MYRTDELYTGRSSALFRECSKNILLISDVYSLAFMKCDYSIEKMPLGLNGVL